MKCYADFLQLIRKVKIMSRACDGKFDYERCRHSMKKLFRDDKGDWFLCIWMTNDSSSDMKCYADLLQLNRKVKIMSRACDDTKFVGEVDINAGLKWWLRGAQGIHINIWRCISSPPLQWPPVLAFLSTRSCDSSEVGEDGMEELVWSTMRRMEWWKRHAFKLREVPPPVTVVSSPCFPVNTENCDSCAVGEDGMEELVWWTMRRMEWWKRHARCEALLVRNCDCASR